MSATWTFEASDGHPVFCYSWQPTQAPRAVIHIAHGMGEHAARYDWTARRLADAGFVVFANDHRGHGRTATTLGNFGADGWNRIIADLHELFEHHRNAFPGIPMILFGHSMGSMIAEQYIELYGDTLNAVILSGSPGFTGAFSSWISRFVVRFERWRLGPDKQSALLHSMIFGSANKPFDGPEATGFEWLSRDAAQVHAYIDDPACGFTPCTGSLYDMFNGVSWTQRPDSVARIPRQLPILVFSGEDDPVHGGMKNMERLLARYAGHGLHVTTRFYPGGRHEMLNETNREEVMGDILTWLESTGL